MTYPSDCDLHWLEASRTDAAPSSCAVNRQGATGMIDFREDRDWAKSLKHTHTAWELVALCSRHVTSFWYPSWWSPCARWYKDANLVLFQCAYQDTKICLGSCVHPNCVDVIDNHVCDNCRPNFICNIKTANKLQNFNEFQFFWL